MITFVKLRQYVYIYLLWRSPPSRKSSPSGIRNKVRSSHGTPTSVLQLVTVTKSLVGNHA